MLVKSADLLGIPPRWCSELNRRVKILGTEIDCMRMSEVLSYIARASREPLCRIIVPVNVDCLMLARKDAEYAEILRGADLVLPDGMPLLWAARLLRRNIPERVTGADLAWELALRSNKLGLTVFFLGAAAGVAESAKEKIMALNPEAKVVGTYSPSPEEIKSQEESLAILRMIQDSGANVLLVGLGAPKQEKWLWRHREKLPTRVNICVGAAFDFMSGRIPRAPKWLQRLGLEWAYRLMKEPRRLWRRYLVQDMPFLWLVFLELLRSFKTRSFHV